MRLLVILWLLLAPAAAPAQEVPAPLSDTLSDYAGRIPEAEAAQVVEQLRAIRAETGVHIVVAVIDRTATYGFQGRIEDIAKDWFNAWGIGDAERNDGVLILVAVEDREMRIALGSGFPVVYDGYAQRVIDTAMLPEFRAGRIAAGIAAGVESAADRIARPFAEGRPPPEPLPEPEGGNLPLYLFIGTFVGITLVRFRRSILDASVLVRRCPTCGQRTLERTREVIRSATTKTPGEGVEHTRCRSCGTDRTRRYTIPRRSSSRSGSSSGGFGGGRSSGGGASGRW